MRHSGRVAYGCGIECLGVTADVGVRMAKDGAGAFPLAFMGYGFLYAWGYVLWCTESLSTRSVTGVTYDLSWLVSSIAVPIVLVALAFVSRWRDVEHVRSAYVAAAVLGVVGTALSVAYQHVPAPLASSLAVASGLCTGVAGGLLSMLWSLTLSRLAAPVLEKVVPLSFLVSAGCCVAVPSLAQVPALVVALALVATCTGSLALCRRKLRETPLSAAWLEEESPTGVGSRAETPVGVARMLGFGVLAWAFMNVMPSGAPGGLTLGVDAPGLVGYVLAVVLALAIIRFAIRVDFQALAGMTLPLFVLSMTLFAVNGDAASFWAQVLNVALNSCCEIILLLYFVRIARACPDRRAFWLALGSAAGYAGVLIGQLGSMACARMGVAGQGDARFSLVVVCAYAFATLLIPQRTYDVPQGLPTGTAGDTASPAAGLGRLACEGQVADDPVASACARLAASCGLSAREAEVCEYLARGRSQTYIRDVLFLSKNTVATHVKRLYVKLGVHSKQELIDMVERAERGE